MSMRGLYVFEQEKSLLLKYQGRCYYVDILWLDTNFSIAMRNALVIINLYYIYTTESKINSMSLEFLKGPYWILNN